MEIFPLEISGAWICKSNIFQDERGTFREWFNDSEVKSSIDFEFSVRQANTSTSKFGVIRGIHFSVAVEYQSKLITCLAGSIRDVITDVRVGSPTFKASTKIDLEEGDGQAILIGPNLGHSFLSRSDHTVVSYLLTSQYSPDEEFTLSAFDADLNIEWGLDRSQIIQSNRDMNAPSLNDLLQLGKLPLFRNIEQ